MKSILIAMQMLCAISICGAQSSTRTTRMEAEYYVAEYAKHYRVPVALVRAIVERESNWQVCTVSPKGAVGLMQLMPATAQRLGVTDRCNPGQNVSGGVRYLARLMRRFHNDLRLVFLERFAEARYRLSEHRVVDSDRYACRAKCCRRIERAEWRIRLHLPHLLCIVRKVVGVR